MYRWEEKYDVVYNDVPLQTQSWNVFQVVSFIEDSLIHFVFKDFQKTAEKKCLQITSRSNPIQSQVNELVKREENVKLSENCRNENTGSNLIQVFLLNGKKFEESFVFKL